jgi:putative transposase
MPRPKKYPDELRERAVRLVFESQRPVAAVARDLGVHKEALRLWVRQAETDAGTRQDRLTTVEREELSRPELRALGALKPHPEDVALAVEVDADRQVAGVISDRGAVADLHDQRVEIDDRVDAIKRPRLPRLDVGEDLVGNPGDHVRRDLSAVELGDVAPDLADRQAACVQRDHLLVKADPARLALGDDLGLKAAVNLDGERDVLGMWFQRSEGAKFWLQILTDLKTRGVQDVLVCCVDGLTGFPDAIEAVFPQAWVQTCIVHLVRSSLRFVPYKDRRAVAADLKRIYTATDQDGAADELTAFSEKWDQRFPTISRSWLDHWEHVTPFLAFPPDLRRIVYTTNTIEALNRQIRKVIKTRGHFPTEDAARKLIYLAIERAQPKWRHAYSWNASLAALKIHFGDRVPDHAI